MGSGPIDNSHLASDPDKVLNVYLNVYPLRIYPNKPAPMAREGHWAISWDVAERTLGGGGTHLRRIELLQKHPDTRLSYWGARTSDNNGKTTSDAGQPLLGKMTLKQRQDLKELSFKVNVYEPDGTWNCQDWIKDPIVAATAKGTMKHGTLQKIELEIPNLKIRDIPALC